MASVTESSLSSRRDVSDAVKTKVDAALVTLTEIWDEVGLSPQQQDKILSNLRDQVFSQVERLVQEEEQIRSQYKEEIATSRSKISSICAELGIPVPEVSICRGYYNFVIPRLRLFCFCSSLFPLSSLSLSFLCLYLQCSSVFRCILPGALSYF